MLNSMLSVLRGVDHANTEEEHCEWKDDPKSECYSPDAIRDLLMIAGQDYQSYDASDHEALEYTDR